MSTIDTAIGYALGYNDANGSGGNQTQLVGDVRARILTKKLFEIEKSTDQLYYYVAGSYFESNYVPSLNTYIGRAHDSIVYRDFGTPRQYTCALYSVGDGLYFFFTNYNTKYGTGYHGTTVSFGLTNGNDYKVCSEFEAKYLSVYKSSVDEVLNIAIPDYYSYDSQGNWVSCGNFVFKGEILVSDGNRIKYLTCGNEILTNEYVADILYDNYGYHINQLMGEYLKIYYSNKIDDVWFSRKNYYGKCILNGKIQNYVYASRKLFLDFNNEGDDIIGLTLQKEF